MKNGSLAKHQTPRSVFHRVIDANSSMLSTDTEQTFEEHRDSAGVNEAADVVFGSPGDAAQGHGRLHLQLQGHRAVQHELQQPEERRNRHQTEIARMN